MSLPMVGRAAAGASLLLLAAPALLTGGCGTPVPDTLELAGSSMGTTWKVAVVAARDPTGERLRPLVEGELDAVDAAMSTWRDDSELSRLNRAGPGIAPVSSALFAVLSEAQRVSELSGGAFDVTVSPLVDAWGFGPPGVPPEPPGEATIAALGGRVGWELVRLDPAATAVERLRPGVTLDLSAIAKGYAVDRVAEELEASGVDRFLVEVGGEVRTLGTNARGDAWRVAVERPVEQRRELYTVVPLSGLAISTSGDYRNYYEVDGERISHTIDPRTGYPVRHRLASVSVVDERCATADAWATALLVLGEEGVERAEELGLAALFLFREEGGGFGERTTSAFDRIVESGGVPGALE